MKKNQNGQYLYAKRPIQGEKKKGETSARPAKLPSRSRIEARAEGKKRPRFLIKVMHSSHKSEGPEKKKKIFSSRTGANARRFREETVPLPEDLSSEGEKDRRRRHPVTSSRSMIEGEKNKNISFAVIAEEKKKKKNNLGSRRTIPSPLSAHGAANRGEKKKKNPEKKDRARASSGGVKRRGGKKKKGG